MNKIDKVGPLIKVCHQEIKKNIDHRLSVFDLTSTQLHTLIMILRNFKEDNKINQRDIEQYLEISNPTVTGILNRLESKKLVYRQQCMEDARVKYILPTKKAIELDKEIVAVFQDTDSYVLKGFETQETENLINYLNRIIDNLK